MINFTATQADAKKRLDKFLTEKLKEQSRSQLKKIIKQGLVTINGKPASVHQFLKENDVIYFDETKRQAEAKNASPILAADKPAPVPKIIFEDNNFLVLEKPAGLLVHPTEKNEKNTLVDWLIKNYPAIEAVGEQKYRAGIIHRLDRDVSGTMVVAKTNAMFNHLKNQFKKRLIKKEYTALVYGHMTKHEGEIDLPIGRSKDGKFVAHPRLGQEKFSDNDRTARTKYQVLEYIRDYTLLKVEILTGRTHQIRAHLSAIGHPILGDRVYKPKKRIFHFLWKKIKVVDPGRIFLHSLKIGFYDLDNNWRDFESTLPEKLNSYLNEIKK